MENQIKADKAESVSPPRTPPKPISLHGRNNAESNNNLFLKIPLAFYEALLISVFLIAVLFGYLLFTRFGLGSPFATAPVELMDADTHHSVLQPIAELPVPPGKTVTLSILFQIIVNSSPGNIAVSVTGRVFFTFHPEFQPINTKVAELTFIRERRNTFRKFPSADFQDECISCLAIRVDMQERLWLLDHAGYALKGTPKLHCFGLRQNETDKDRLLFTYEFPAEVAGMGSFLNDFQIDQSGKFIYIADTSLIRGDPGIVVFSVENKKSFR